MIRSPYIPYYLRFVSIHKTVQRNEIPYHNWGLNTMKRANNSIHINEYVKKFLFDTGWEPSI